jgi:hypothetical protein
MDALLIGLMDLPITCNDRENVLQNVGIQPENNMKEAFTEIRCLLTHY